MILFALIFALAADECRLTVFVNQRCVFAWRTFELKSSNLRFEVPVAFSFPDESRRLIRSLRRQVVAKAMAR
jgi:hypothetical protein